MCNEIRRVKQVMTKSGVVNSFYGFPSHLYKEKFAHRGSPELAQKVLGMLNDAGVQAKGVTRGLDHGVWVPFKCGMSISPIATTRH